MVDRRPSMRVNAQGWRRLLRVSALIVMIITFSVASASRACDSLVGNALVTRVDAHLAQCLPGHNVEAFTDAFMTNELDETQRRPLAVVAVSSSTALLDRFAAAVATAVVGRDDAAAHLAAVRVVDLTEAAASPLSTHAVTQAMRHDLSTALMSAASAACPQQRTLVVVRGLEAVRGDKLPLLDVFLDPLNGERATLHDAVSGRDLDCRRTLVVFLYHSKPHERLDGGVDGGVDGRGRAKTKATWRDFLVDKWRASADATNREAFTPEALAARLTMAVELVDDDGHTSSSVPDEATCGFDAFLARLHAARRSGRPHGDDVLSIADALLWSSSPSRAAAAVLGAAVLVVGLVLVSVKKFVANSKQKAVQVEMLKDKKSKKRARKHRSQTAPPQPDSARIASLRSHSSNTGTSTSSGHAATATTATATTAAAAVHSATPNSPVLSPASTPQHAKTASPDPKTPTPTKPRRTGRRTRRS